MPIPERIIPPSISQRPWPPVCWVVTDGKAGMENQCLGLAEAMGLSPVVKRVRLRKLWRELSPYLTLGKRFAFSRKGDGLSPPWPDLVIGTGRMSVLPVLYVKQASGGRCFTVQIQNPAIPFRHFDRIILPAHDNAAGGNAISVVGGLHRLRPDFLAEEGRKWASAFARLPRPLVAVLLGGSNAAYRLGPAEIMQLGPQLEGLAKEKGCGLLVTPSRRTGAGNMTLLRALLHDVPAWIWDGSGDNPFYAMLELADSFIVTCDSVNMLSEAASTGKPLHMVRLPGHAPKFAAFHESLVDASRARWFSGRLEHWNYEPLNEVARAADLVKQAYLAS